MSDHQGFKGLEAWQVTMNLVEAIYHTTTSWPPHEQFGLTNQVRRASVSVPSNIAEGHGRKSPGDFLRFISISLGSLAEIETQLLIADRLGYMSDLQTQQLIGLVHEATRVTQGFARFLRRSASSTTKNQQPITK